MPPPYPGTTRSLAMYVSERTEPPGRISGPRRASSPTSEYADTLTAARYPARLVSSSGFFTSGPLASEWTTMSIGFSPKSFTSCVARPAMEKSPRSAYRLLVRTSSGASSRRSYAASSG